MNAYETQSLKIASIDSGDIKKNNKKKQTQKHLNERK